MFDDMILILTFQRDFIRPAHHLPDLLKRHWVQLDHLSWWIPIIIIGCLHVWCGSLMCFVFRIYHLSYWSLSRQSTFLNWSSSKYPFRLIFFEICFYLLFKCSLDFFKVSWWWLIDIVVILEYFTVSHVQLFNLLAVDLSYFMKDSWNCFFFSMHAQSICYCTYSKLPAVSLMHLKLLVINNQFLACKWFTAFECYLWDLIIERIFNFYLIRLLSSNTAWAPSFIFCFGNFLFILNLINFFVLVNVFFYNFCFLILVMIIDFC